MGISLGMSMLMRIIGTALGPALVGMNMQSNQSMQVNGIVQYFPSANSYNLIFLTAIAISIHWIGDNFTTSGYKIGNTKCHVL